MEVLIDTNILVDFLTQREPFAKDSTKIVQMCISGEFSGAIAAHSLLNIFYLLRKDYSEQKRRELLQSLCDVFTVVSVDREKIESALSRDDFSDFEDCVQDECAISASVDYIVTRNTKDFALSKIPAIEPDEFLAKMQ